MISLYTMKESEQGHSPGIEHQGMAIENKKNKKGATETKLNFFHDTRRQV
jgi:hypothetical protein